MQRPIRGRRNGARPICGVQRRARRERRDPVVDQQQRAAASPRKRVQLSWPGWTAPSGVSCDEREGGHVPGGRPAVLLGEDEQALAAARPARRASGAALAGSQARRVAASARRLRRPPRSPTAGRSPRRSAISTWSGCRRRKSPIDPQFLLEGLGAELAERVAEIQLRLPRRVPRPIPPAMWSATRSASGGNRFGDLVRLGPLGLEVGPHTAGRGIADTVVDVDQQRADAVVELAGDRVGLAREAPARLGRTRRRSCASRRSRPGSGDASRGRRNPGSSPASSCVSPLEHPPASAAIDSEGSGGEGPRSDHPRRKPRRADTAQG